MVTLLHIPSVQRSMGGAIADFISEEIGSEVSIGSVNLGLFNRLVIDDVLIKDLQDEDMFSASRLAVKVDIPELIRGRFNITSAQIFSPDVTIYQTDSLSSINCQFILDVFESEDSTESKPLDLSIGSFILRHGRFSFDKRWKEYGENFFNPNHLSVTDVNTYMQFDINSNDSLNLRIKELSMKEHSGLEIENLKLLITIGKSGGTLSDFELALPNSFIEIDSIVATWDADSTLTFEKVKDKIAYNGNVESSGVTLSDISPLLPTFSRFTDKISFKSSFSGTGKSFFVERLLLSSSTGDIDIDINGWVEQSSALPTWNANINSIEVSAKTVKFFYDNFQGKIVEAAEPVKRMGDIKFRGSGNGSSDGNITFNGEISTATGNVVMDIRGQYDKSSLKNIEGSIFSDQIDVGTIAGNPTLGYAAADIDVEAKFSSNKLMSVTSEGTISARGIKWQLAPLDYHVDYEREGEYISSSFLLPSVTVIHGDSKYMAKVNGSFKATDINDSDGYLTICDFAKLTPDDSLYISDLTISSGFNDATHFLMLRSDFGTIELAGHFNFSTLPNSIVSKLRKCMPNTPGLSQKTIRTDNNFNIAAEINDTHWIRSLFGVELYSDENITLTGSVEDATGGIKLQCSMPHIAYGTTEYTGATLSMSSLTDSIVCVANLGRVNGNGTLTKLKLQANAANDVMTTRLNWWDSNDELGGEINARAIMQSDSLGKKSAEMIIDPSIVNMGEKMWDIKSNGIRYSKNNLSIDGLSISSGGQYALIRGTASDSYNDTLDIFLNGIEVSSVLDMVNFHSVEFSGAASGHAIMVAPFGEMQAWSKIHVDNFLFQNGRMGVLDANVLWNSNEKQIEVNAISDDGPGAKTYIDGYVAPGKGEITFDFRADGTYLDFILSFTPSFMTDIDGQTWGTLMLRGTPGKLNLLGEMVVDANAFLSPVNCWYKIPRDTIFFVPNEIEFHHAHLLDHNGNSGWVDGQLHHKNIKNLSYDLNIAAENLLCYDFRDFGDDVFYGTVYGTGDVKIHGGAGRMDMDINITPNPHSSITYDVASAEEVDSEEDYITWNDITPYATLIQERGEGRQTIENKKEKIVETASTQQATDMYLNFLINMNSNASIRLLMDPATDDYITLHGNGVIRANYYNKGAFQMYGTYHVSDGTYGITIQDILKKNFTFLDGSSIVFGGNPFDASLNLKASYTVNGVSLSDLNIGNSYSSNTIRVSCLMDIGGVAANPQVTFDLDMPTVSTDVKQMIKSLINSEEEMNQQVVYLLAIGRFYPQGSNNSSTQSGKTYSETTLAMNSLLSGTLSSQINQLLGSVIRSDNWTFGANISTGNEGWNNAEYEGLISGRLLNNRLLIDGQFGYRDNVATNNQSFIGDFDIRYLLFPNGNLALRVYNQSNDRYFTKSSLNTQGVGIIMKKDFTDLWDLTGWKVKYNR